MSNTRRISAAAYKTQKTKTDNSSRHGRRAPRVNRKTAERGKNTDTGGTRRAG